MLKIGCRVLDFNLNLSACSDKIKRQAENPITMMISAIV